METKRQFSKIGDKKTSIREGIEPILTSSKRISNSKRELRIEGAKIFF